MGFNAYLRFWKQKQNPRHIPTWSEFEKTSLYAAFVRFGKNAYENNYINPMGYVDFLLRYNVGIDDWCKDSYYQRYVRELNKQENPQEALERGILLMEEWANKHNQHWSDFFRKVSPSQAVLWVMTGRISPFLMLTASSFNELLSRMDEGQKKMIFENIDQTFWEIKIKRHEEAVKYVKQVLLESGV